MTNNSNEQTPTRSEKPLSLITIGSQKQRMSLQSPMSQQNKHKSLITAGPSGIRLDSRHTGNQSYDDQRSN
jgi:hypothetical protein